MSLQKKKSSLNKNSRFPVICSRSEPLTVADTPETWTHACTAPHRTNTVTTCVNPFTLAVICKTFLWFTWYKHYVWGWCGGRVWEWNTGLFIHVYLISWSCCSSLVCKHFPQPAFSGRLYTSDLISYCLMARSGHLKNRKWFQRSAGGARPGSPSVVFSCFCDTSFSPSGSDWSLEKTAKGKSAHL